MQSIFKCVQPTLPRAANAIFSESAEGNLFYKRIEYDIGRESRNESGHVVLQPGDSGAPFWTTQKLGNEQRAALVGLNTGGVLSGINPVAGEYVDDPNKQCRQYALKITSDMRDWLDNTERPFRHV